MPENAHDSPGPWQTAEEIERYVKWWGGFTGRSPSLCLREIHAAREQVSELQTEVSASLAMRAALSREERQNVGRRQQLLKIKKKALAKLEVQNPYAQPQIILAIPRVESFELAAHIKDAIVFKTQCLYGRDLRSKTSPWCKIGRVSCMIISQVMGASQHRSYSYQWTNLDGNQKMSRESMPVPSPQVRADGTQSCLGQVARDFVTDAMHTGNVPKLIATLVRFTESADTRLAEGFGMGEFERVPDDEVPEFYLKSFPR